MNKIFAIGWKDALIRFSDKTEILFFLILPVVFTLAISGASGKRSDSQIILLVVDLDKSAFSSEFVAELKKSVSVEIKMMNFDEAQVQFEEEKAPIWITIPSGFERSLLSGLGGSLEIHKLPLNNDANAVEQGTIRSAISRLSRVLAVAKNSVSEAEFIRPFASAEERQLYYSVSLAAAQQTFLSTPDRIVLTHPPEGEQISFSMGSQASAGQLVTWVFIPLLGLSSLLVWERESHTLQRLITTPTSRAVFLVGTISGQLLISIVQMGILVCFGVFVLNINWGKSISGLALLLFSFGTAAAALGTALGTFIKTSKQASNLSIALGMVMALLGGAWWPSEMFPQGLRTAMKILPTSWVMQGLNDLAQRGKGFMEILPIAGVLIGFAVVFLTVGIVRFRYE